MSEIFRVCFSFCPCVPAGTFSISRGTKKKAVDLNVYSKQEARGMILKLSDLTKNPATLRSLGAALLNMEKSELPEEIDEETREHRVLYQRLGSYAYFAAINSLELNTFDLVMVGPYGPN